MRRHWTVVPYVFADSETMVLAHLTSAWVQLMHECQDTRREPMVEHTSPHSSFKKVLLPTPLFPTIAILFADEPPGVRARDLP